MVSEWQQRDAGMAWGTRSMRKRIAARLWLLVGTALAGQTALGALALAHPTGVARNGVR